jgi:hypothetical protein
MGGASLMNQAGTNTLVQLPAALNQTNHFFNLGYGWLCKHCSAEDTERKVRQPDNPPRNEMLPFAYWDPRSQILSCRRCGIKEFIRNP